MGPFPDNGRQPLQELRDGEFGNPETVILISANPRNGHREPTTRHT